MKPRRFRNRRGVKAPSTVQLTNQSQAAHNRRELVTPHMPLAAASDVAAGEGTKRPLTELDSTLLERARALWQVGDWTELARLGDVGLEQHPLRAKLALLVATAQHQLGRVEDAGKLVEHAERWGCPRDVLMRAMLAGAFNSLGKVQALRGRPSRATASFSAALAIGFPGSEHRAIVQARMDEQIAQLGLAAPASGADAAANDRVLSAPIATATVEEPAPAAAFGALDRLTAALDAGAAGPLPDPNADRELLQQASDCLARMLGRPHGIELALDRAQTTSGPLVLIHARDDYIPNKVVREGKFYELEFLEALTHFHRPDGLVIDVGANIGNHTVYFARVLGAQVAAFEPQPHNILCLELNVRLNGVGRNVTTYRCALGREPSEAVLSMSIDSNYGSFSAVRAHSQQSRPENSDAAFLVPVRALDDVLSSHLLSRPISLIKVDVEGMELDVLQGATQTIGRSKPLIACECSSQIEFARVEVFLSQLGYSPAAVLNVTPTFLFYCADNTFHVSRLAQYLRRETLSVASTKKGFLRP